MYVIYCKFRIIRCHAGLPRSGRQVSWLKCLKFRRAMGGLCWVDRARLTSKGVSTGPRIARRDLHNLRPGRAGIQQRDFAVTECSRGALVDIAFVGDLIGVDRRRIREEQHPENTLREARMRRVPTRHGATDMIADHLVPGKLDKTCTVPSDQALTSGRVEPGEQANER